jgi:hypothetical protein
VKIQLMAFEEEEDTAPHGTIPCAIRHSSAVNAIYCSFEYRAYLKMLTYNHDTVCRDCYWNNMLVRTVMNDHAKEVCKHCDMSSIVPLTISEESFNRLSENHLARSFFMPVDLRIWDVKYKYWPMYTRRVGFDLDKKEVKSRFVLWEVHEEIEFYKTDSGLYSHRPV